MSSTWPASRSVKPSATFRRGHRRLPLHLRGASGEARIALGFNAEAVVHSVFQHLSAPTVSFPRLHAYVIEPEMDMLEFSVCQMAEPGTGRADPEVPD